MNEVEKYNLFRNYLLNSQIEDIKTINQILDDNVKSLKKVEILACIISHGGLELESNDFSDGSTVTRIGLKRACIANGVEIPKTITKKSLLIALLKHVKKPYIEGDISETGSTIERVALVRVYRGLLDKS
jgi:hypothetical protein